MIVIIISRIINITIVAIIIIIIVIIIIIIICAYPRWPRPAAAACARRPLARGVGAGPLYYIRLYHTMT